MEDRRADQKIQDGGRQDGRYTWDLTESPLSVGDGNLEKTWMDTGPTG